MKESKFLAPWIAFALSVIALGRIANAQSVTADTAKKSAAESQQAAAEKSLHDGAAKYDKAGVAANDFCQCINVNLDAALRIEQALAKSLSPSGWDYADTPLSEVANQLERDLGIPFVIDKPALEEAGIGTDAPVTMKIHNISLRSALRLLLKQLGLTYIVQDESLLITTREAAEANLKTCVYDVRSFTNDREEKPTDALIKTIQSCIARDTWKANGRGEAEISAVKPGVLVITQTHAVHEEIHDLLATIKRMTQNGRADNKTSSAPEKNRTSEPVANFATKSTSAAAAANGRSSAVAEDLFR